MSVFTRVKNLFGRSKDGRSHAASSAISDVKKYIDKINGVEIHRFSDYDSYLKAGSDKIWATFKAMDIIANNVSSTPFNVFDKASGEETTDDGLISLLQNPNPYDSWEEILYLWSFHMKLVGNAYWVKDNMDMRGRPESLYPLIPSYVRPVADKNTKVSAYIYQVNGTTITFDPEEIIHFKRPHPNDSIMGIGDIEPAESLFNDFINRNVFNEKFIENGASPSGILIKKKEVHDQEEWERVKKKWNSQYSGKANSGKTAWLNGEWDYVRLGLSARDMQDIEKQQTNMKNIFIQHGVPLSIIGIEGAANYATARQDRINFRRDTVLPLVRMLASKLNRKLLPAFDLNLKFGFELSGLVDVEQVVKDYMPVVEAGGMTLNELRVKCGLPETDNPMHDQYFIGANRIPLEMAGLANPEQSELDKITNLLKKQ